MSANFGIQFKYSGISVFTQNFLKDHKVIPYKTYLLQVHLRFCFEDHTADNDGSKNTINNQC